MGIIVSRDPALAMRLAYVAQNMNHESHGVCLDLRLVKNVSMNVGCVLGLGMDAGIRMMHRNVEWQIALSVEKLSLTVYIV